MGVNGWFIRVTLFFLACTTGVHAGPQIQHWFSAKGAQVYFVEAKGLPLVDIQMVFDAGSARDEKRFGVAALTAALLDKGAGKWSVDEIAQRLEGVGAQLATGISQDTAWISLRSLIEPRILDIALDTSSKIVSAPNFSRTDFQREKKRVLAGLKQQEESPAKIADRTYFQQLYGAHPYAHPTFGAIETVEQLKRRDVQEFFTKYYVAKNALIVIVGDVSREKAESIADRLLVDMEPGTQPADLPPVVYSAGQKTESIPFPSTQTHIYSGMPAITRGDPDYFPLYVGNHILGGSGLVSRISEEIREKRGLAYSAFSYFSPLKRKGPFSMGLQTRNDQADEALGVLNHTIDTFIRTGPSEEELQAAKKNITGGFVLRIDSNSKVAEYVAMIGFYQLPLEYLDTFSDKVNAVTRQDITKAFQNRIDRKRFQTVLVGGDRQSAEK